MKRLLIAFMVLFGGATSSLTIAGASNSSVVQDVTKANDMVQLATKNYDEKTIDRTITPDFVLVLSKGKVMNRAAFVADIGDKSATWVMNKTESLSVYPYNDDCAVAIGILHLQYKEKNKLQDRRLRFTDVWVKQNGQWKWASSSVEHLD